MEIRVVIRIAITVICALVVPFLSPDLCAQSLPFVERVLTEEDQANLALGVLQTTLDDPSCLNIHNLLAITPLDHQQAVRRLLPTLTKKLASSPAVASLRADSRTLLAPATLSRKGGKLEAELWIPPALVRQPGQEKITLRFRLHGSDVVFDNLPDVLSSLGGLPLSTSKPETLSTVAASPEPVRGLLSPNLFVPRAFWGGVTVLNSAVSQDQFGADVLSGPAGACAVQPLPPNCISFLPENALYRWHVNTTYSTLLVTDRNWNRLLYAGIPGGAGTEWIKAVGSYGSAGLAFKNPMGIDVTPMFVYVADTYNKRVVVCTYDGVTAALGYRTEIKGLLVSPVDVATYVCKENILSPYYKIAVLDQSLGEVQIYRDDTIQINHVLTYNRYDFNGPLLRPTGICWGRHPSTGAPNDVLYILDNGNKRILQIIPRDLRLGDSTVQTATNTFPADAYLTAIETDYFGWLYVTDATRGCIYQLDPGLKQIYATYGYNGSDTGQFNHPTALAHGYGYSCQGTASNLGDFVLCESYGPTTGVQRLLQNYDMSNLEVSYHSGQGCNWYSDYLKMSWEQTGPATAAIEIRDETWHVVYSQSSLCSTGPQVKSFYPGLTHSDTLSHSYYVTVTLTGLYSNCQSQRTTNIDVRRWVDCQVADIDRIFAANCTAEDPTTGLEASVVWGYAIPTKWWKIYLWAVDRCPDPAKPITYSWHSAVGGADSVEFSPDPFTSRPVLASDLITSQPWVYAHFWYRANPSSPAVKTVARVWLYADDSTGRHHPPGYCNPPSSQQTDEVLTVDYQEVQVNLPYVCASYTSSCPSRPPDNGAGCPHLYALENGQYSLIDNLLPQSELDTDTAMKRDFCLLRGVNLPDTGGVALRISEEEQEISQIDRVGLVSILVPRSVELPRITHRSEIVALTGQFLEPSRVVTSAGEDITPLLQSADGSYFSSAADSGYLDLDYALSAPVAKDRITVSLEATGGGVDLPPPVKSIAKPTALGTSANSLTVLVRAATGEFQPVAVVAPRVSRVAQFVDLSDFASSGLLHIRLKWTGSVQLDHLPYRFCTKPAVTIERSFAMTAVHSQLGSVLARLRWADGRAVKLEPGQYIDLSFGLAPLPDSVYRLPIFVIDGRYARGAAAGRLVAETVPASFAFEQNYPNPFNPSTTFRFSLPSKQFVKLEVFNVLGQKVATLLDREVEAGEQIYQWNGQTEGQPIASGVYLAKLTAGSQSATRKMVVVK